MGFHLNRPLDGRLWDAIARATIERMGGDDVLSLERMAAVARLGSAEGKPMEVAAQHLQALALAKTLLGADHPLLWKIEFDLGSSLVAAKDPQGALPHLERALQLREKEVSGDHPEAAMVRSTLANAYFYAGRVADSRDAFSRALTTREKLFGADSPRLIVTLNNFGDTLNKVGRHDEAAVMVTRAAVIAKKAYPVGHPYIVATTLTHSEILLAMGRHDEARTEVELVLTMQPPPTAPYLAEANAVRSSIALTDGKPKDALSSAMKGVEAGKQVGERSPELVLPLLAKGEAELALKDPEAAVKTFEQALALVEETQPWRVYIADAKFALARARTAAKREPGSVKELAAAALELYRGSEGQDAKVKTVEAFLKK